MRESDDIAGLVLVGGDRLGSGTNKLRAVEAGFDQHLVKPLDPSRRPPILRAAAARRGPVGAKTPA